ncbi:uncharacterized protein LOC143659051 [Tamandua tetradactyla]|uniref:uncharacterized protein LOC143659051 n=1 Tax=Tamandua tetradactyla TaxID=48850 RepID=UPI004054457B
MHIRRYPDGVSGDDPQGAVPDGRIEVVPPRGILSRVEPVTENASLTPVKVCAHNRCVPRTRVCHLSWFACVCLFLPSCSLRRPGIRSRTRRLRTSGGPYGEPSLDTSSARRAVRASRARSGLLAPDHREEEPGRQPVWVPERLVRTVTSPEDAKELLPRKFISLQPEPPDPVSNSADDGDERQDDNRSASHPSII